MKKYIITSLLIVLAVSFWNCEKDDICAQETPTTPRVIVEFYDAANPTELKNVTFLEYVEVSSTDTLTENGVSKIEIPLKTTENLTTFKLILNGGDDDESNNYTDEITFNYNRIETYISRACGYKTTFILNQTDGVIIPTTPNWFSNYEIVQSNINNEDETHVKIYF